MKKTKRIKNVLLLGLLSFTMLGSLAGCGLSQKPDSAPSLLDNTKKPSDSKTEGVNNSNSPSNSQTENQTQYISDLLHPTERTIWYSVSKMDKEAEISAVIIIENNTITFFDKNGSDLELGDVANMSDEEVYNMAENAMSNYVANIESPSPDYQKDFRYYLKYDTSDLNYFITTDASGNNAVSETVIFPTYTLLRSDEFSSSKFSFIFPVDVAAGDMSPKPGQVSTRLSCQIYDTSFVGWSNDGKYIIRKSNENESPDSTIYFTDNLNPNKDNLKIIYGEDPKYYFGIILESPYDGNSRLAIETPDGEKFYYDVHLNNSNPESSSYVIIDGYQKHPYTPDSPTLPDGEFDDEGGLRPEDDINGDGIDDRYQGEGDGF